MKVLFLDIDGVLNSAESDARAMLQGRDLMAPDPRLVVRLLGILQDVQAITGEAPQIVLTSSWRLDPSIVWPFPVFDRTPRGDAFGTRATEIRAWLEAHPTDTFVILDDEPDAGLDFGDRFVQTDQKTGLSRADAAKIVGLFT